MCIEFRAYYIRPDENSTGSLGVHPDDNEAVERWRERHGIATDWAHVTEPRTGLRLNAFQPIEGGILAQVEALHIQDGQLCRVTYRAAERGGRMQMHFDSIVPL